MAGMGIAGLYVPLAIAGQILSRLNGSLSGHGDPVLLFSFAAYPDRLAGAGGFVDVVSAPGQGTTVSGGVPVPARPVHVVAAAHASSSSIGPNSDLGM